MSTRIPLVMYMPSQLIRLFSDATIDRAQMIPRTSEEPSAWGGRIEKEDKNRTIGLTCGGVRAIINRAFRTMAHRVDTKSADVKFSFLRQTASTSCPSVITYSYNTRAVYVESSASGEAWCSAVRGTDLLHHESSNYQKGCNRA